MSGKSLITVAVALIVAGFVLIVAIPTRGGGPGQFEMFAVGSFIGSIFGHAVAASAWSALGPGPLYVRIPLAILWCGLLWIAMVGNILLSKAPAGEIIPVMAACIAAIWLTVQAPYWLLRWFGGMKLEQRGTKTEASAAPPQYGIAQLMIFTSIVAVIFGAGRAGISFMPSMPGFSNYNETVIFAMLALASVLISLPLVPSIFLPRYALPAVICCLLFTATATWIEMPLFSQAFGGAPGPQFMHFVGINAATAAWVVALALVVRRAGYQLTPRLPTASTIAVVPQKCENLK